MAAVTRLVEGDVLRALKAAVTGATEFALQEMRQALRARTTSTRLPNIIGARVYPTGPRLALQPAGVIAPRGKQAENILRQLAEGATITVRRRKALAIPVHNMRDANGKLLPPAAFPGLIYIPPQQRDGVRVGVLAIPARRKAPGGPVRASERRRQRSASRSRTQPGVGKDFTVMFVLVRTVRIPKAFDPNAIMRSAEAQLPGLFDLALASVSSGPAASDPAGPSLRRGSMAAEIFARARR